MSRSLVRTIGNLLSPSGAYARLAVFCYHQVLERKDPLRQSEPDREDFKSDIEIIGRTFTVMDLPEAVDRLQAGTLPPRAGCITFDDGYANNHELAAPLLERAGLPATFFIAGDAVDSGVMFNDLIIEGVRIRGRDWMLGELVNLNGGIAATEDPAMLIGQILQRLKYLPTKQRATLAHSFFRENANREAPRLMMDRADVADLARRGFDIGGHTLRHSILKELSDREARQEIEGCFQWLEETTGHAPESFAYPNGIPERDFGPEHENMVRESGFRSAVSTYWSVAAPGCGRYRIPRVGPWWRLGASLSTGFLRAYGKTWLGSV